MNSCTLYDRRGGGERERPWRRGSGIIGAGGEEKEGEREKGEGEGRGRRRSRGGGGRGEEVETEEGKEGGGACGEILSVGILICHLKKLQMLALDNLGSNFRVEIKRHLHGRVSLP